ncbi:PQQ-binding-like beta-propeller repeat protein [Puniceibacterium sp. IMCC21224]|uniref:pyrroloquinoline quinone-dependent dehydrogenase n=1 Tax=Puniceibacterium sp. IMCC21224 TaxID=1618204 RepID=UPI00064D7BB0|nr:PQQ-binding-like beta-propeller repeat protein [Puniceibacterium sp. IMCC21224]KMK65110.1 glucose dehydrogenase [Puniceibacterium sp. IMCC21224]
MTKLKATFLVSAVALGVSATFVMAQESAIDKVTPVTDEMLLNPPDGDWLQWRRTYDGWGYSPLDQINKENVKDLKLAWSWGMTPGGRSQETPLIHDGIMYIQNSTHLIQALNAATGDLIWEYQYDLPDDVPPNGERSKSIYGDKLIISTRDAHLIALDTKTGKLIWDQQVANSKFGFGFTSGSIIADGVIVQGMTGCSNAQPGGCFFTGHDVETGEELWRVNTIARGDTPEGNSWNGIPLESRHGGSAWIAGSYDPEQKLIFAGVGQPYPWIAEISGLLPKSSDPNVTNNALYTDSTLAIDVKTGDLKWYHQYLPNDSLDLDYVYERLLIDLPHDGTDRKMVVTSGKIGIIEALDRTTGEWLWSKETVPQNVVLSIDPETGEKTINPDVIPHIGETTYNCPADPGGRAWQATAYSPRTQALYMPTVEFCSNTTPQPLDPGEIYTSGGRATFDRVPTADSDGNIGQVRAIKLTDQSDMWMYRQHPPITSSTLPTAGGVVFVGSLDRKFFALDDETGEVLWTSGKLPNALESFPVSYEADGKQYIAVVTNWASGLGRLASLTPEVKLPSDNPHAVYVFALPD